MISTLSHEQAASVERASTREKLFKGLKSEVGNRLDEIAVFALVAAVIFYIAAASCWFIL
jgi:hypothetical protein